MNDTTTRKKEFKDKIMKLAKPIIHGSESTAVNLNSSQALLDILREISNLYEKDLNEKDLIIQGLRNDIKAYKDEIMEITRE